MLDYARQHAMEALGIPHTAILVTNGPAGVQASEFPCEAMGLDLYLLIPRTSDHLFNLEHESTVTLLLVGCELKGKAQIISRGRPDLDLNLLREPEAKWCVLVQVEIARVQIRSQQGWGNIETIDLSSP
jgi:hypothetical protein